MITDSISYRLKKLLNNNSRMREKVIITLIKHDKMGMKYLMPTQFRRQSGRKKIQLNAFKQIKNA